VLTADGLRPTTDRTKETLFNWLMLDVQDARCLDCFAGAGSLGFEALSRGAATASFMELDKQAAKQLIANSALLKYSPEQACILQGNTLHLLSQFSTTVDIIFIDPPFQQNLVQPCITLIDSRDIVKLGTKIYIEREVNGDLLQLPDRWRLIKDKSTQQVSAQLYLVE
jgi:16S rRNA (guanine966-N2)-methyltransferase